MRIQIAKSTPLAWAPDAVCKAINRWTDHYAFLSNDPDDQADVIHFNNTFWKTDTPAVIQYHSEPTWKGLMLDCPYKKLVNAQYHMLLPEYADCDPVRQVINFCDPEWDMLDVPEPRIGYSPTSRVKVGQWHDKGYEATVAAIKASGLAYDIIEGVSPEECIERKRHCSIIIDECVTGSYHRSGLEGLALGKRTIGCISGTLQAWATHKFGSMIPICQPITGIKNAIGIVLYLSGKPGFSNRLWMLKHWHPADVVQEYVRAYEEVLAI